MSTDAVKKRGRPKKAVKLEEEVSVIEESSKPKQRKPTSRKQTGKAAKESAKSLSDSNKAAEGLSASGLLVKGRANGRNVVNSGAAKHNTPSTAGSATLQQATAFTTAALPTTSSKYEVLKFNEANRIQIDRPIALDEAGSNVVRENAVEATKEDTPRLGVKVQETQLDRGGTLATRGIQESADTLLLKSTATPHAEQEPVHTGQYSHQEPAAPMSTGGSPQLPSGRVGEAAASVANTTSLPLKSEPPPAVRAKTAFNTNPRLPASFSPTAPPPPSPRPTQLPYHELKKNPEFKALSRKYTSLIVAIPIALFTSYILYSRYTNQIARRRLSDQAPPERNGGAKPRLLVENASNTVMPIKDTTETASGHSDRRLLEE